MARDTLVFARRDTGLMVQPIVSIAVFDAMRRGRKIEAIKALRTDNGTYTDHETGSPMSVMGLKEAKEIIEAIEETLWPPVQETCEHCHGRGVMDKPNMENPFNRGW